MNRNTLSIIAYVIAAASMVFLIMIHHLFARGAIFIGIQVASVLLMMWARKTFGFRSFHAAASTSKGELITTGPYHYWRHPIYASIIYFVWAGQFHSPAILPLILALLVTFALFLRMISEEHYLKATYPDYIRYMQQSKRFIPYLF